MSSTTLNGASEVFTSTATVNGNPPPATQQSTSTSSAEEIGWYFVESYYTTLNRTPERLHLFYQKQSSFIWGLEGENVAVSQGRNEISERIKRLSFNDCKVRVTNVDTQSSLHSGILVQVLGDMINNSEPSQRFAQTFFLAEQTNPQGYYVLNDIFRYLKDEEEEEVAEPAPEEIAEAPVESVPEPEPVAEEQEPEVEAKEEPEEPEAVPAPVPEKEEVKEEVVEEAEKVEETPAEPEAEKVEEPVAVATVTPAVPVVPAVPVIPTPQPETTEPEPTPETPAAVPEPVNETPQAPPPVPQEPPKPAKPSSWAALLAPKTTPTAPAPVATQAVAPVPTTTAAPVSTPSAPATTSAQSAQANSGWQTTESRRQNRPVSMSGAPQNAGSAYVKGVSEKVSAKELRAALEKFGTVNNVEIVLEKKCAFVEFGDGATLLAAAKENPHRINGQMIYVEERRPRPGNYGGPRGGGSNLRGGERQGSRGGSQRGPGDRDRFDSNRNSIGGGRGQGGNVRGGGQYPRGGRGGAGANSSN